MLINTVMTLKQDGSVFIIEHHFPLQELIDPKTWTFLDLYARIKPQQWYRKKKVYKVQSLQNFTSKNIHISSELTSDTQQKKLKFQLLSFN